MNGLEAMNQLFIEKLKQEMKEQQKFMLKNRQGFLDACKKIKESMDKAHKAYKEGLLPANRKDEYIEARKEGLKLLISNKKCIDIIENNIRFVISIRQCNKKNALKYHKLSKEAENNLMTYLMGDKAMEVYTVSNWTDEPRKYKGDSEIARQHGKLMLNNDKERMEVLADCEKWNYFN